MSFDVKVYYCSVCVCVCVCVCVLPQTVSDTCCPPSHLQEAFLG